MSSIGTSGGAASALAADPGMIPTKPKKSGSQWACWRLTTHEDGRPARVPVSPARGQDTDHLDPKKCRTFDSTNLVFSKQLCGRYAFVFSEKDQFCEVDLDDVLDPESDQVGPWAAMTGKTETVSVSAAHTPTYRVEGMGRNDRL